MTGATTGILAELLLAVLLGVLPGVLLYRESRRRGFGAGRSARAFLWGATWSWPGYVIERRRLAKRAQPAAELELAQEPLWTRTRWGRIALLMLFVATFAYLFSIAGLAPREGLVLAGSVLVAALAVGLGRTAAWYGPPVVAAAMVAVACYQFSVRSLDDPAIAGALALGATLGAFTWWQRAITLERRR